MLSWFVWWRMFVQERLDIAQPYGQAVRYACLSERPAVDGIVRHAQQRRKAPLCPAEPRKRGTKGGWGHQRACSRFIASLARRNSVLMTAGNVSAVAISVLPRVDSSSQTCGCLPASSKMRT